MFARLKKRLFATHPLTIRQRIWRRIKYILRIKQLSKLLFAPHPLLDIRMRYVHKHEIGSYEYRLGLGAVDRPHYGYCVYHAAELAKKLGIPRISVVEFGVAGGNGLVNLEYHAQEIEKCLSVGIEIYGFDTGEGLPKPQDFRDLPYHWKQGFFRMDVPLLERQLKRSNLVFGDIRETSVNFFERFDPAPIGAIMHDFDYYSSTLSALQMLEGDENYFLPRVFNYFDDIAGSEIEMYCDYTGERLAINEFNEQHEDIKIADAYYLLARKVVQPWYHQIRICHFFKHSQYNNFICKENEQRPLQHVT